MKYFRLSVIIARHNTPAPKRGGSQKVNTAQTVNKLWRGFEKHLSVEREGDLYRIKYPDFQLLVIDRGRGLVSFYPIITDGCVLQGNTTQARLVDINLENPGAAVFIFQKTPGYKLFVAVGPGIEFTCIGPVKTGGHNNPTQLKLPFSNGNGPRILEITTE